VLPHPIMEKEYRVATSHYGEGIPCCHIPFNFSRSFRKNLASVEILSLKISFQCSSMNRVVDFVRREFPDMLDDESTVCVREVPKLAV